MKTTFNKSEIFKQAWSDLKDGIYNTISEALKYAWSVAKGTAKSLIEYLKEEDVKQIFSYLTPFSSSYSRKYSDKYWELEAEKILNFVAEKSKGFQADIAEKALKFTRISEKQAWCVAFEFKKLA